MEYFIMCLLLSITLIKYSSEDNIYRGQHFPLKYLQSVSIVPKENDLKYFVTMLKRTVDYFAPMPNNSDCNVAFGHFLMSSVLRKALVDDGNKLNIYIYNIISDMIRKGDRYVSHYIYQQKGYGFSDMEYRVSQLCQDSNIFTYSMSKFNENRLNKWILSDIEMHPFVQIMDNATLCREKYLHITENMENYHTSIYESDRCLSNIVKTAIPINISTMQPCKPDKYCKKCLTSGPSVAYAISHRLLNLVFRRNSRRCYIESIDEDEEHIDKLCAFMFREAVYIARRGYFARDMFLEHVGLCSLMGYKEFHRLHWFYKATTWIDQEGCIKENPNLIINRSRLYKANADIKNWKKYTKQFKLDLLNDCQSHPMALLIVVLAHAIRYAAHFML